MLNRIFKTGGRFFVTGTALAGTGIGLLAALTYSVFDAHAAAAPAPGGPAPIVWDALEKDSWPKPGDPTAQFTFTATNDSDYPVTVQSVQTSCGCTVAKIPSQPWVIQPHGGGDMTISVNLAGKTGTVPKTVTVNSEGLAAQILTVVVHMPDSAEALRLHNMEMAKVDRQAVFKGDCASCHAAPAAGKMSKELYVAVCGVCHEAKTPASVLPGQKMVPDLKNLNHPTDYDFWKMTITIGKPGTLMPAFGQAAGGPLTDEQIDSLAKALAVMYPSHGSNAPTPARKPEMIRVPN